MSADETGSQRERELRQSVAQLREQLEEEKRARKRAQHDKVREVKTAREKEQDIAKETIEALKIKQQREKAQEMSALQERMTKDLKAKMKETQRKHEEEKQRLQRDLDKERQSMNEQRKKIEKEVQKQMQQTHETELKKLTQEMFTLDSQQKDMEKKWRDSQAADRTKAEVIRDMEAKHQAELESYSRSSRLSSRQQLVELEASKREVKDREKEISTHLDRIRRMEADKDRLEEEVRRLRRAESWARSTPTVTPPSLTPSTSAGDLTSPRHYTVKERDMVVKNTELSFRVRTLEEQNAELEKNKKELKERVEKIQAEQKPLKEQLAKQGNRVNSLNASLHDKEKMVKRAMEENEELKKANKELAEERAQQKRRLNQQMNQTHTMRMEHQRAVAKNIDLQKVYKKLQGRVKELEQYHRSISQVAGSVGSEYSSPSVSLVSLDNSVVSSEGGREVDAEQAWVKYREMKKEYVATRENYKKLKSNYDKLVQKHQLLQQEKLAMEEEVSILRASPLNERDSPFDMQRSSTMLSDHREQLDIMQTRVRELESFIVEQDKKTRLQKEEYGRELMSLTQDRDQLQERLESIGWEREEGEGEEEEDGVREKEEESAVSVQSHKNSDVLKRISLVEEMNLKATAGVKETKQKAKVFGDYHNGLNETLQGIVTLEGSEGEEEEEEEEEEEGEEEREGEERVEEEEDREGEEKVEEEEEEEREGEEKVEEEEQREGEEIEGEEERERVVLVLKKAQETVKEVQQLLSSGQDASPVVEKLAVLLAQNELSDDVSHPLDNSLAFSSTNVAQPVGSSTPSVHTPLVTEIGRLKEELLLKQEAVHQAQEKVSSLQTLIGELEGRLEEERRERENLAGTWEQEMAAMQLQLSQKESKLTRLRRAISQGVNEHMHQQLGHQVLHTLKQCKSSASVLPGSEALLSELSELETSLQSLLHTVLPGMVQQTTPPPAPTEPVSTPPFKSMQSEEEVEVTPLSSLSSSSTHFLPQSPQHSQSLPPPPLPDSPPPSSQTLAHSHSPPSLTQSPPHTPTDTTPATTPLSPVKEVMVMRPMVCEEITIPLSAFLFEAPSTDFTHFEPQPSHTPPESPFQTPPESEFHSNPELPSSPLPPYEENALISESADQFMNSPSHISIPEETTHENCEEIQEGKAVEQGQEGIEQPDGQIASGPPHISIPADTSTSGREYMQEDLDEVSLGPEDTEQETGVAETGQYESTSREDTLSPSPCYSLPPEARTGQRVSVQSSVSSPVYMFGKKRLRSQSMEQDEMEEEEEEQERDSLSERGRKEGQRKKEGSDVDEDRLFVAILSYDPEAMCTTGRPDEELLFHEGAIIAVRGSVNDDGFYRGSFEGKTGLVPAGFVQEMEVEDSQQRKRLLNQTLSRPPLPSFLSQHHTPLSSSRPTSASLFSQLTPSPHSPFFHTTVLPPPDPPTSVTVESTREKRIVMVSWTPPTLGSKVTGYQVFVDKQVKASVMSPQTKVLVSDIAEDRPVVVGVVSHDQDGQQSSVASATYMYIPPSLISTPPVPPNPSHSSPSPVSPPSPVPLPSPSTTHLPSTHKPEQYRLCIALIDYDPEKMSPSESPHLELKMAEGNLLRCYTRAVEEDGYTMAELGESNKRGLVPTEFITEVYGPSSTNPQKYEWKSPSQDLLPATSKLVVAVYDYNSREDSPNRGMELELSFKNGDTITVYGGMDADGFYCGRVGEAFGLVPSNFLQVEEKKKKKEAGITGEEGTEGERGGEKEQWERRLVEKWDIPPGMWRQELMNGHKNPEALAAHSYTESDARPRKISSTQPDDDHISGSGSLQGSVERKKRWSHGLPRPNFKLPFSRKKSDSAL